MDTKATRLEQLSAIVSVPPFIRVAKKGAFLVENLPFWNTYIVRGVSATEDQQHSSHAGQFITIGPIERHEVSQAVQRILREDLAIEVIIQEYREGLNGVAFCFENDSFYVEYSGYREGVTAGKVRPFVALLPVEHSEYYSALQEQLGKIFSKFGPCDVEFVGVSDPSFVQVRPITSGFEVDAEMIRLQMRLQEAIDGKWVENDLSQAIGEHKDSPSTFVFFYMRSLASVYRKYFKKAVSLSSKNVIQVGSQFFVSALFLEETRLSGFDLLRFTLAFFREQDRLRNYAASGTSLEDLFERSILSSMAYTLLKKREFFDIREEYRQMIDRRLMQQGEMPSDSLLSFPYSGRLDGVLEFDRETATWKALKKRGEAGRQIVPGMFDHKKFFHYREGFAIPDGAVVICDYLYPDIGKRIDSIAGVICANGSVNSHVAILCREKKIPLMIQAEIEKL